MNSFTLWVGFGATLGLWRVTRSAPQRQAESWANAGLLVLFAALVGARLAYVLTRWPYFSVNWIEAPQIWLGGLDWTGAAAGAALAILFLATRFRSSGSYDLHAGHARSEGFVPDHLPLGWLGDHLYPLLPPLAVTTWLGCWQAGTAYGAVLPAGTWYGIPTLDESGVSSLRFPLQPLAALVLLLFFLWLERRVKPLRPAGRLSGLAICGLLLHLMIVSLFRADPVPHLNGLPLDTWIAGAFLALFLALVLINNVLIRLRAWKKPAYSSPEHSSS